MIQILDYSYKLKRFLSSENIKIHLEKFKIFLRLDFSIDVYIVSKDVNSFGKDFFSREFSHSLLYNKIITGCFPLFCKLLVSVRFRGVQVCHGAL